MVGKPLLIHDSTNSCHDTTQSSDSLNLRWMDQTMLRYRLRWSCCLSFILRWSCCLIFHISRLWPELTLIQNWNKISNINIYQKNYAAALSANLVLGDSVYFLYRCVSFVEHPARVKRSNVLLYYIWWLHVYWRRSRTGRVTLIFLLFIVFQNGLLTIKLWYGIT